ncbi:winged helix-turn-helix transcriptional regulator [Halorientalis salina]|uniref:winged helix-turn-helix transcriptional regulator n=1 Tax=Halorientalis salina TaxID=2932266 RepID=UPI0010AC3228|nr:winged helix-turn-helix transcriptional regulator [Halorientalis salina]
MRGLDDTDREILSLLLDDGRRPYSDIAERVDLSPPAVSDRIDRLEELGLLRGFTVDIDRSMLREGVPVLVDVQVEPGNAEAVRSALSAGEITEHVFATADERVVATATVPEADVQSLLESTVDVEAVVSYEVDLLTDRSWTPSIGDAELAASCAECGNTVTTEGETARLDGTRYQFCCSSCKSRFVDQFEELREGADS